MWSTLQVGTAAWPLSSQLKCRAGTPCQPSEAPAGSDKHWEAGVTPCQLDFTGGILLSAGGMLLAIEWEPVNGMHCRTKMQHAHLAGNCSLLSALEMLPG